MDSVNDTLIFEIYRELNDSYSLYVASTNNFTGVVSLKAFSFNSSAVAPMLLTSTNFTGLCASELKVTDSIVVLICDKVPRYQVFSRSNLSRILT